MNKILALAIVALALLAAPQAASGAIRLGPDLTVKPCEGQTSCGGGGMAGFSGPIAVAPSGDGSVVYVPLACPANSVQPCGGFLDVSKQQPRKASTSRKRKLLTHVRFSVDPGKTKQIRVKLSKARRKLLKRKRRLKVVLTIRPNEGEAVSVRRTLKWRK